MPWTTEQILALAPDESSVKSGKGLSVARKWDSLGCDQVCAWGTIQGSGKDPYQTCIDLIGPAFKCTCPSRKFPCKHGLALFLILAQQPGAMTESQPPLWTAEWLAKRADKEEKKAAKSGGPDAPPDPEEQKKAAAAAEKRAISREAKVTAGLEELGVWLNDLVRNGFAALPGKPASFWETPAARLLDAQAPGLARRVRALDGITASGELWPAKLLRALSLLHLAREAWSRLSSLRAPAQADLRAVLGFTISQEEVLAQPSLRDHWLVLGQRIEEEDALRVQRTWLWGTTSKRFALNLSFSAGPNQPLDISFLTGTTLDAELVFFPGSWPLRALVKHRHGSQDAMPVELPHSSVAAANGLAADALTANPWIERVPFALAAVTPLQRSSGWILRDDTGHFLPLDLADTQAWRLVALAAGRNIAVAGEWDGERLHPLSAWADGHFVRV